MTKLELGRIGISLNISADESHLTDAVEIEKLGYSTIWVPGGQLDRLDRLAEIVDATTTISVASGIIPVDVYPPAAVSTLYAELEARAPGRLVVGLGGPQTPRPLAALNQYLDELDAGHPPVPAARRILAALGPRKLEIARDRSAGAIALLVTPGYTADARRTLGPDATLVIDQFLALDTVAERARDSARGHLKFLAGVPGYAANFARLGFSEAEIADVSDRLVDELVAWGDVDAIAARVAAQLAAGADQVMLGVLNGGDQLPPIAVARQLAARLLD